MRFRCPMCQSLLSLSPKVWVCANGHSYDVSRQGYLNLLLVQQKNSREPGDTSESLIARRDFLESGHYQRLRDCILDLLKPLGAKVLIDMGCGEGYYTTALTAVAEEVIGVDIAKAGIALAARRSRAVTWLVASSAALPVEDASVDLISNLFCPLQIKEIQRVLKPGGHVLIATPAAEHLWALREALFGAVYPHEPEKFLAGFEGAFDLEDRLALDDPLELKLPGLKQLLAMTPYAWKARPDRRAALELQERFSTRAAFSLLLFRRR